jgi:hypothetical protein
MGKRISPLLAVGLAVLAIAPDEAFADLGLIFDRARAVPGERVEAFSGQRDTGRPSANAPIEGVKVYFVPVELAVNQQSDLRSTGPPSDARWLLVGSVHQDADGVIRMRFRIPQVPPGDYTTGFWCRPCAPPKGGFFTSLLPRDHWRPQPYGRIIRIAAATPTTARRPQQEEAGSNASTRERSDNSRVVLGILAGLLLVGSSVAAVTVSRRRTRKR